MALSEDEQRLLAQMEAALAAEDPKLAHALRGSRAGRTLHRRRAAIAGIGFVAGTIALIAGMQLHWILSVIGFIAMLAATVVALTAYQRTNAPGTKNKNKKTVNATTTQRPFMNKMEERWRRRQDEGL